MKEFAAAIGRDVSRETLAKLDQFADLILSENTAQNLISKSSEADLWRRHILDSAQLLRFADPALCWSDIGTGAGLPGIVLAILDRGRKILIEPRRLRVEFLTRAIAALKLNNVTIVLGKADKSSELCDVITARAVSSPGDLFAMTSHLRHAGTTYVLPRGRGAQSELAEVRNTWQGEFRLHPSLTSDEASILVARNVRRRG